MNKQSGLTLVEILISAGLAILLIGGGVYLYQAVNRQESPAVSDTNENATGQEVSTETEHEEASDAAGEENVNDTLQTYKNEEYEFVIRYPEDFEFGGPNPEEKLLFSLSGPSENIRYEFWIRELDGKTLEAVFEEKLNLEGISYFDWIRDQGGEVSSEIIGENTWLFIDGSAKLYLDSHYLVSIPGHDAYLVVDLGFPTEGEFPEIKSILATLHFN